MPLESSLCNLLVSISNQILVLDKDIPRKNENIPHSTTTSSSSQSPLIDFLVESFRSKKVAQLRQDIETLLKPHISIRNNNSSSIPFAEFRKNMNSLFPTWSLTASNFEWKRNEPIDEEEATRSWVAPLFDEGCEVFFNSPDGASTTSVDDEKGSQKNTKKGILCDWKQGENTDDFVLVQPQEEEEDSKIVENVPLNSVRLVEPKLFCRDPLIPSNEDEPAGRCGNSALYSKLAFNFKIKSNDLVKKLTQQITKMANDAKIEIWKYRQELLSLNSRDSSFQISSTVLSCPSSSNKKNLNEVHDAVIGIKLKKNNSEKEDKEEDIIAQVSSYHLSKLFLLFLGHELLLISQTSSCCNHVTISNLISKISQQLQTFSQMTENSDVNNNDNSNPLPIWFQALTNEVPFVFSSSTSASEHQENQDNQEGEQLLLLNTIKQNFLLRISTVLTRYLTLDGGPSSASYSNMHAAIHPDFAVKGLHHKNTDICSQEAATSFSFKVQAECFANPFNCGTCVFGSLFKDTDQYFGSQGSFWDWEFFTENDDEKNKRNMIIPYIKHFEVNPPFESNTVRRMTAKLFKVLKNAKNSDENDGKEKTFVIVLPEPQIKSAEGKKFSEAFSSLMNSEEFSIGNRLIEGSKCPYVQGNQQHMEKQSNENNSTTITSYVPPSVVLKTMTLPTPTRLMVLSSSPQDQNHQGLMTSLERAARIWEDVVAGEDDDTRRRQREE